MFTKKVAIGNLLVEDINNFPTPKRRALPKPPPTNTMAISFIINKDKQNPLLNIRQAKKRADFRQPNLKLTLLFIKRS